MNGFNRDLKQVFARGGDVNTSLNASGHVFELFVEFWNDKATMDPKDREKHHDESEQQRQKTLVGTGAGAGAGAGVGLGVVPTL